MDCILSITDLEREVGPDEARDVVHSYGRHPSDQYPRDPRLKREDIPWLSAVKLSWGPEVCLLNISNTGMLVETTLKFTPGSVTEFQLCGPDSDLVVPARFVRSEVATVDACSVRYHAAVAFAREVQLPRIVEPGSRSTPRALADLLNHVLSDLGQAGNPGYLRSKFEQELRKLVSARDIQLHEAVAMPRNGSESVYFTVPSAFGSRAILQATFEAGREPLETEFRLLKSAATLAAVVLEFEQMR
jgi:hypothetical protein